MSLYNPPTMICGLLHMICLDNNGYVWFFGDNEMCIDSNKKSKIIFPPKKISKLKNISSISCGSKHIVSIDYDGNTWIFGINDYGQLGIGKNFDSCKQLINPHKLDLPPIKQVSCGAYFTICKSYDNRLWSFGCNANGQLGQGHTKKLLSPTIIPNLDNIDFVVSGGYFAICKSLNNEFYSWGYNREGELGQGDTNAYITPTLCENWPENIISVNCSIRHILLLSEDGIVYSCGDNGNCQLGLKNTLTNVCIPTRVEDLPEIEKIYTGDAHSVCIDKDKNMWGFGFNKFGQLGLNDLNDRKLPTLNPNIQNIIDVSCGGHNIIIKTSDNEIYSNGLHKIIKSSFIPNGSQTIPIRILENKEDIWLTFSQRNRKKSARK